MQATKQLACPNCGNALTQHLPNTQTIVCSACNSHVAIGMEELSILSKGNKLGNPPRPVTLGQKGTFNKVECVVLGRVLYEGWDPHDSSDRWRWTEWLLGAKDGRLFWLAYDDEEGFAVFHKARLGGEFNPQIGHIIPVANKAGLIHATVRERYPARIVGAEGELTWQAKADDSLGMIEAAMGGKRYSMQVNEAEIELYEGVPMDEQDVAAAFQDQKWIKKSQRRQRNQFVMAFAGMAALVFACVGLVLAAMFWNSGEKVASQTVRLDRTNAAQVFNINVTQADRPVMVKMKVDSLPVNNYAEVDISVTDAEDNEYYLFSKEFWYETGVDSDGSWSESDYSETGKFVPKMTGEHEIEVALSEISPGVNQVSVQVEVYKNHVNPTWFFGYAGLAGVLGLGFLAFAHPKQSGNFLSSIFEDD